MIEPPAERMKAMYQESPRSANKLRAHAPVTWRSASAVPQREATAVIGASASCPGKSAESEASVSAALRRAAHGSDLTERERGASVFSHSGASASSRDARAVRVARTARVAAQGEPLRVSCPGSALPSWSSIEARWSKHGDTEQ